VQTVARTFRTRKSPLLRAVAVNAVIAVVLLAPPFVRGHLRSRSARAAFGEFVACLFGGSPVEQRGLRLPAGEREQFASQALGVGPEWPRGCIALLRSIPRADATFLWPATKKAEADLRAAAALTERELNEYARVRGEEMAPVSPRPLIAVSRLRAALSMVARASWDEAAFEHDAVRFEGKPGVVSPVSVPFSATVFASLHLRSREGSFRALGLDRRGIARVRVSVGKVEQRHLVGSRLLRAVLSFGEKLLLVWSMPRERCRELPDGCVRRATGVAFLEEDADALPKPIWLKAHPAARPDRSIRLLPGGRIEVLALFDPSGVIELRRFDLTGFTDPEEPLSPLERIPVMPRAVPTDALVHSDGVFYAADVGENVKVYLHADEAGEGGAALASLPGPGGWIAACSAGNTRWLVLGTNREVAVLRSDGEGAFEKTATLPLSIADSIHDDDPALDNFRILCVKGRAQLLARSAHDGSLSSVSCTASRGCGPAKVIARSVYGFDAVSFGDNTVVAYCGDRDHAQIRVVRLDSSGRPAGEPLTPAVCWARQGGLCGIPGVAADEKRVLVAAREPGYLRIIESTDGGKSWSPMSGMKGRGAGEADATSTIRAHRDRIRRAFKSNP
jgi:hypothetical protein